MLDEHEVRYCVLHSWERLPEELSSDLDIAVHPEDQMRFAMVVRSLAAEGYRPVQSLNYLSHAYYFVFAWFEGTRLRTAALDTIFDHWRSGLCSLRGEEMVAGRRRVGPFRVARPEVEFTYLVAKRVWKRTASSSQLRRLTFLAGSLGRGAVDELAGRVFLGKSKRRVVNACLDGSLGALLPHIGAQPSRTALVRHPLGLGRFLWGEGARVVRRWFQPTGLFLVVLGPDGVGKSTLVERLREQLGPCFRRVRVFHWRPMVIGPSKQGEITITNPHQKLSRGPLASCITLLGLILDYWLGYIVVVRPFLARSGLVIFDRYYQDLLVDPRRYRYGGPMWFAKALSRLVPSPDLPFLVLDAKEETILSRKQEVSPKELHRQLQEYRDLAREGQKAVLVNADTGVEATLSEVTRRAARRLAERFERREAGKGKAWRSGGFTPSSDEVNSPLPPHTEEGEAA